MFDGRWRNGVDRTTKPVGERLRRMGVTADLLTGAGIVLAVATAWSVGMGHLHLAILFLTLTGCADLLDGPVAKASGTASMRGAFFDSVMDRVADAVIMGGVAWYLISRHDGHLALLPFAVLGVTTLVSYERAKAEALGLSAKGGLMERAERIVLLGIGFLATWLLVPVLWAMLVLVSLTAVARFVRVWNLAEGPAAKPAAPRWREARVESRWRARREGTGGRRRAAGHAEVPFGRWRARRQAALASRTSRALRARRATRPRAGGTHRAVSSRRRP